MSTKFDEFPLLPFQDIQEKPKHHGRTDTQTDGQHENSILRTNIVCGGGGGRGGRGIKTINEANI